MSLSVFVRAYQGLTCSERLLDVYWLWLTGFLNSNISSIIAVLNVKSRMPCPILVKSDTEKAGFASNLTLEKSAFDGTTNPLTLISCIDESWSSMLLRLYPRSMLSISNFKCPPNFFYYKYELGGHIFVSNKEFSHATVVLVF